MNQFSFKKVLNDVTNKTISKIKGQDNPEYYQAPSGFIKYELPLVTDIKDINMVKFINYIQSLVPNNRENAIRLYSLLEENEEVLYTVNGTIKQTYLLAITNFNRLIITSKESYKILKKDEIKNCSIKSAGILGIDFIINDISFLGGNEKELIYNFLKVLQDKKDNEDLKLTDNNIKINFNFIDLVKLNILNKMYSNKKDTNELLVSLLKEKELVLAAIYGNTNNKSYILAITSEKTLYMVSKTDHLLLPLESIKTHEWVKSSMLSMEFIINNFYFTNGSTKDNIDIFFKLFDDEYFNKVKEIVINNTKELIDFEYNKSNNLLTGDYHGLIINEQMQKLIVVNGLDELNVLNFKDVIRYELPHNFNLKSDNYDINNNKGLFKVYEDISEITKNSSQTEDIILILHTRLTSKKEIKIEFIKDILFNNSFDEHKYNKTIEIVQQVIDFLDKILAKTNYIKIAQAQIARESSYEELRKLKKLVDEGIISEEDFEKKKKEILNIK